MEDALQDAHLIALQRNQTWNNPEHEAAWIRLVAKRIHWKRSERDRRMVPLADTGTGVDPWASVDDRIDIEAHLDTQSRRVRASAMCLMLGLSAAEQSRVTGHTIRAVTRHRGRLRAGLRGGA